MWQFNLKSSGSKAPAPSRKWGRKGCFEDAKAAAAAGRVAVLPPKSIKPRLRSDEGALGLTNGKNATIMPGLTVFALDMVAKTIRRKRRPEFWQRGKTMSVSIKSVLKLALAAAALTSLAACAGSPSTHLGGAAGHGKALHLASASDPAPSPRLK